MTATINNFFKNILCLTIAILISLMQLQFFEGAAAFSIEFLIILVVTVPTVYLYFLPKHETIIIFLYNIVLVYILDALGRDIDIRLFLMTLFCIILLFAQSLYTSNTKKMKTKNPSFLAYCIILALIFITISCISFFIYEYVLKPNTNEQNEISLLYKNMDEKDKEIGEAKLDQEFNDSDGEGGGGAYSEIKDPIDFKLIFKFAMIFVLFLIILYIMIRIIRYKLWLKKTLKSPIKNQIYEFYRYSLRSLAILGFKRSAGETPFEYLKITEREDFPLSKSQFTLLTDTFVATNYGEELVTEEDYEKCLGFFYSISKILRKKMGICNYLFRYLVKVKV